MDTCRTWFLWLPFLYYSSISSTARDHYVYNSLSLHKVIWCIMYHCISGLQDLWVNSSSIAESWINLQWSFEGWYSSATEPPQAEGAIRHSDLLPNQNNPFHYFPFLPSDNVSHQISPVPTPSLGSWVGFMAKTSAYSKDGTFVALLVRIGTIGVLVNSTSTIKAHEWEKQEVVFHWFLSTA